MHIKGKKMYKIVSKKQLSEDVYRLDLEAPKIALKRKPGQFVILRLDEFSERIPLTIVDSDTGKGIITIIVQAVGETTRKIVSKNAGEEILDVAGPLGRPQPQ